MKKAAGHPGPAAARHGRSRSPSSFGRSQPEGVLDHPGGLGGLLVGILDPQIGRVSELPLPADAPVIPVVVQQPVVVNQNVWVEGRYVDQVQANGTVIRVWQPGHYEQREVLLQ